MFSLGASFDYRDAIDDLKTIYKSKGLKVEDDILIYLAMELVKAEQNYRIESVLKSNLSDIAMVLNYPFNPLISSFTDIANSLENLGEEIGYAISDLKRDEDD